MIVIALNNKRRNIKFVVLFVGKIFTTAMDIIYSHDRNAVIYMASEKNIPMEDAENYRGEFHDRKSYYEKSKMNSEKRENRGMIYS